MQRLFLSVVVGAALCSVSGMAAQAQSKSQKTSSNVKLASVKKTDAKKPPAIPPALVAAKPLSESVKKGLAWLVKIQHDNGGWSQGEESEAMRSSGGSDIKDKPNVGDTCMATMALMRAGSAPGSGPYAKHVRSGILYVCSEIEESDKTSLFITNTRNTRLQMKLGPYIDTFLASYLLADVSGKMTDSKDQKRVAAAFHKVMDKIEKNQKANGTWDDNGWAPVLSQSFATRALNRAAQNGYKVNEKGRLLAENFARGQFDSKTGSFGGGGVGAGGLGRGGLGGSRGGFGGGSGGAGGSAGVELYSAAGNIASIQDSAKTNEKLAKEAKAQLRGAKTEAERRQAKDTLKRVDGNLNDFHAAQNAIVDKVNDPRFISGFGSNGGEEFLSYMNIGESLVTKGGDAWKKWDESITKNLNQIQNQDGTWSGQHCITGRTFCTAAALMVLMVDRANAPIAQKIKRS